MLMRVETIEDRLTLELGQKNVPLRTVWRWLNPDAIATLDFADNAKEWALVTLCNGVELVIDIRAGSRFRQWFARNVSEGIDAIF